MSDVTILRADRWCDVETGEVKSPAVIVVDGNSIVAVNPPGAPSPATEVDLGGVTLAARADGHLELNMSSSEDRAVPTACPTPCTG